jgi:unsaturated rhamnogalacturonyl hydrolase
MMRKYLLLFTMLFSWTLAGAQLKTFISDPGVMARRFAESEMTRFPEAWQLDHGKRLFFGYAQGVGCCAMLGMWKATGDEKYYDYVHRWTDTLVAADGKIWKYDMASYNLDFINSGKTLFDVYARTGEPKYKTAMQTLRRQLRNQPRTCDGGFWHKLVYQHQMWLDGLYMASPFLARYGAEFRDTSALEEAVLQVQLCHRHTYDTRTGLYFHAWDESRRQRWADADGHSPNFWGRSTGWWFMAMVDILDWIPVEMAGRDSIVGYIRALAEVLPRYQRDGLWYQVLDCPDREGNFPEASVTTQFMYAYAKAVRKGYIDARYLQVARDAYEALQRTLLVETDARTPSGEPVISLTRCCAVGGLGGNPYRDGSFDYYIHEKMRDNDAKATGPFIMGCLWLSDARVPR